MNFPVKIAIPTLAADDIHNYVSVLRALNADPITITVPCSADDYGGLILPGGEDIDPSRYGEENVACGKINGEKDILQFTVLDEFVRSSKPIFGICRGLQLLNTYFGGTLIQNICDVDHHRKKGEDKSHMTEAVEGSYIFKLYGRIFAVNSAHHQAVDRIGVGLVPAQYSDDGIIEAFSHASLPVYGVQWHPERMCFDHARADTADGSTVLSWFLSQCR